MSQRKRSLAFVALAAAMVSSAEPALSQTAREPAQAQIQNALSAAPPAVAAGATVVDFQNNVLRKGTTEWVCMPDNSDVPNNSPMCLDKPWMGFIDALMHKREPKFSGIGIGYMLQGDMPVSNVDPFATTPTPDNQWVPNAGPHIMLIISDAKLLQNLSADPKNGGPWVMWKDTPYAHVMIPSVPLAK